MINDMDKIIQHAGDVDKIAQNTINMISEKINNLKTLNIIVAGKTGVGKSTLINSVFKENLAETGMGKPVTGNIRKITKNGVPLAIYDTRGLELGKEIQSKVKHEVIDTINKGLATHNINETVHCIWYCINTASNRIEPEELDWIRELSEANKTTKVPIIIILTQSFSKSKAQEMRQALLNENLDVVQIIPVLAENYEIDNDYVAKAYGLDVLIKVMGDVLPDELIDTLQNVQIASLKEKKRRAQAAIAVAVAAAVGLGATPIPFSDCALLIPTQLTMVASITAIFGFDVNKSVITALISSTIGAGGSTILGKTVVTNILKLIPGFGTIVGGAISAATAGVITAAFGEAYIGVMELVFKGDMKLEEIGTNKGKKVISDLFKKQLKEHNKTT